MAENRLAKKTRENAETLRSLQVKPSISDNFTQALVGFLPLIAGLGSSEDAAALAPIGLGAMQQVGQAQKEARDSENALNMRAFEAAQKSISAEDSAASKGNIPMTPYQQAALKLREQELAQFKGAESRRDDAFSFKMGEAEKGRKERLIKTYNSDKLVQKYQEGLDAANNVRELIAQNSPMTEAFAKRSLARLSGEVGVLTDQDVAAFGGSRALLARGKQALESARTGKITPENKKYMLEVVELLEKVKNKQLDDRTDKISSQYGQVDGDKEAVKGLVAPASKFTSITKEQAMAELARRKAAKAAK